jgi:hypothetical protein
MGKKGKHIRTIHRGGGENGSVPVAVAPSAPAAVADVKAVAEAETLAALKDTKSIFYAIMLAFMVLILIFIVLASIYDFGIYLYREAKQIKSMTVSGDQVLMRDTTDFNDILNYPLSTATNEKYNVYRRQGAVYIIIVLMGISFMGYCAQLGMFKARGIYASFKDPNSPGPKDPPFNEKTYFYLKNIGLIAVAAIVLNSIYSNMFIDKALNHIVGLRDQMGDIRRYVISNIPLKVTDFWPELKELNVQAIKERVARLLAVSTSKTDKNARTAQQIVFACNLYAYFYYMIPSNDTQAMNELNMLFSTQGNKKEIDVNKFFFYHNNLQVESSFNTATILEEIKNLAYSYIDQYKLQNPSATDTDIANRKKNVDDIIATLNTDTIRTTFNDKKSSLKNINTGKEKIRNFLVTFMIAALIFMGIFIGYNWNIVGEYFKTLYTVISALFAKKT